MQAVSGCPKAEQLDQLIRGELPEDSSHLLTSHLETCSSCQATIEKLASGEIPIGTIVADLSKLNPSDQSDYWKAISKVEEELEIGNQQSSQIRRATPQQLSETSAPDATPLPKRVATGDLDFLEPSDDPAYIGKLQHFQIARVIGRGGMGIVLEAFDTHLHRNVAVKVLNPSYQANDVAKQRFCREGRAAAAISHEHVVPMYHVAKAQQGEVAYLVMQLIEGETLENRLRSGQPLPAREVARLGMQIAAGLSAAHKKEMIHRDIKPANIMIETETNRVKLTDFGLARASDDIKLTQTGMITGTPLYMSPEQTLGEATDERSDLFSLGAVLYEMATGAAPFQASSALGVMQKIMNHTPDLPHQVNPQIKRPLSDLIMSLLAKKPDDRPESAAAVATALASIVNEYEPISPLETPSIAVSEVKKLSGSYRRYQRKWILSAWIVSSVCVLLAIITWYALRPDRGDNFPSFVLEGNPGTVWSVDFDPTGHQLASAIEDGSVRIWDLESKTLRKSFNAHRGVVWLVAYHPTRPIVMTSGDDSTVRLWNSETFDAVREWKLSSAVRSAAFSPSGDRIAAGDREGMIHVFDIDSGEELITKTQPGSIMGIDYSANGKLIATVGSDKIVRIFDAESLAERQSLSGHDGPIYGVKFAPQGSLLATVGWHKNVRIWDSESGIEKLNLLGSDGDVWGVSFCGDGTHLVTGEQMGAARVWDVSTGKAVTTLRGHTSAVHNVSLDSVAHRIATSSRDGTIRVWDMSSVAKNKR